MILRKFPGIFAFKLLKKKKFLIFFNFSYLRGRDTCDDLNNFLTTIIIKCFTDKYTLSCKSREAVIRQADLNLWMLYQQQKQTFPS